MLLILIALGGATYGVVRLGKTLTPGQRVVLALIFIAGVAAMVFWLINAGLLGRFNS